MTRCRAEEGADHHGQQQGGWRASGQYLGRIMRFGECCCRAGLDTFDFLFSRVIPRASGRIMRTSVLVAGCACSQTCFLWLVQGKRFGWLSCKKTNTCH